MNKFFIVLGHTFFTRLKSKSFLFSTAFILLLLTLFANIDTIVHYFMGDDEGKIAVIDETDELYPVLEKALADLDDRLTLEKFDASEEKGKEAVQSGEYDGLLVISYDEANFPKAVFYENDAVESWNQLTIE